MPRNKKEKLGSVKTDPLFTSDDFRMYCFKVMPCSRHYTHDWTECPYAHPGEKATRRDPRLYSYTGIECPHVKGESAKCPRGDMCPFAHNVFECWLHPTRYRTQMCNEPATCRRKICFFAHSMQEMREATPVSQDVNISLKGPRRLATAGSEKIEKKSHPSPRVSLEVARSEPEVVLSAAAKARASFDGAKRQPTVDLPPRTSLDSSASRLGLPSRPRSQAQPETAVQNTQLLSLIALLQQQQQQQQQQMQMKADSFDLASALSQLSLAGAQQQQPCLQQGPYGPSAMAYGSGQTDQLNEILRFYLQQQLLNPQGNMAMNQHPSFPLGVQSPQMNMMGLPAVSESVLLQQQLQSLQALGPSAGLRSSLDSNLSNTSGRIPARVSFDGVTSAAPGILQQAGLNYMDTGVLQQRLFGGMSPPVQPSELLFSQNPPRSSTESSATESFGCISGDSVGAEPLKQPSQLEVSCGMSGQADDFISINQGPETFVTANTVTSTAETFQP